MHRRPAPRPSLGRHDVGWRLRRILAGVGFLVVEAVVASAWDLRRYSYADDCVNVLGSRFSGEFEGSAPAYGPSAPPSA
jgi:hypothetical protein